MGPATQLLPGSSMAETLTMQAERIAARYAPAYVVLDAADNVTLFSAGTERFVERGQDDVRHLPALMPPGLVIHLRALLDRVRETGQTAHFQGLVATRSGNTGRIGLTVEPLPGADADSTSLMVLFQDEGLAPDAWPLARATPPGPEQELREARERLDSALRKLAASGDEYAASIEELETSNKQLLFTREELQVTNDALTTRVGELDQADADIHHMMEGTRIAIAFLDGTLRIRSFTPAMRGLFHLIDSDVGRPLLEIATTVGYPHLPNDFEQALLTKDIVEREVESLDQTRRYLARILPYGHAGVVKSGLVLVFIEITAVHDANLARREVEERLHGIAASVPAFLFIADLDRQWDYVNPPFYAFTGLKVGAALGQGWLFALHPSDLAPLAAAWMVASAAATVIEHEIRVRQAGGSWCWFLLRAVPQTDARGAVTRWFGSCTDIDQRRQAETRQGLILADLQHRVKNIMAVVRSLLTRTLQSSTDLEHFADHFAGRLGALARVQTAAARTPERVVMLGDLVAEELFAHGSQDDRRTHVTGPDITLTEKLAGALGLAMHELTANALKFGGLSVPTGQVAVGWHVEPVHVPDTPAIGIHMSRNNASSTGLSERLTVVWEETGVPITDLTPKRHGFGRELIEQGLPYEVGATTLLEFRPGGIRCSIVLDRPSPACTGETW